MGISGKQSLGLNGDLSQTNFGWLCYRPTWLQSCDTINCFFAVCAFATFLMSFTRDGYITVVLPDIEKRFQISSSQSSWVVSVTNVTFLFTLLVIGAIGNRLHKPKWLAIGAVIFAVGCIVFSLPHFVTSSYKPWDNLTNITDSAILTHSSYNLHRWPALLMVGRGFQGIGGSFRKALTITTLHENMEESRFAFASAMYDFSEVAGITLAFLAGGFIMDIYVDTHVDVTQLGFDKNDKRWVGAWWLGYVVVAFPLLALAIPMSGYGRRIPNMPTQQEAKKLTEVIAKNNVLHNLKCLVLNKCYILIMLAVFARSFLLSGTMSFGVKYIVVMFAVSTSSASMFIGLSAIPATLGGTLLGGFIIKRFKLRGKQIIKLQLLVTIMAMLAFVGYKVHCEGTTLAYLQSNNSCVTSCQAESVTWDPICSVHNVQYDLPCLAGCHDTPSDDYTYSNCSCIQSENQFEVVAISGACGQETCHLMPLAIALLALGVSLTSMQECMETTVLLGVVKHIQRPVAYSLYLIFGTLGSITAPLAQGLVFDASCSDWTEDLEGDDGACSTYKKAYLSWYLLILAVGGTLLRAIFLLGQALIFKSEPNIDDFE